MSVEGGPEVRIRDDIECGDDWFEMQVSISRFNSLSACGLNEKQTSIGPDKSLAPGLVYADDTIISRFGDITFHPVRLFLGMLPSWIRNGYQNGGSILIGYIPKV